MNKDKFYLKKNEGSVDLQQLIAEADAINALCVDYEVPGIARNMVISNDGNLLFSPDGRISRNVEFTDVSLGQLCTKLSIPSAYAQKCMDAGKTKLLAKNMNSWLRDQDSKSSVMVRTYGDSARAIVSPRFTPYDSHDVLRNIEQNLDTSELKINHYCLNEEVLQIRFTGKQMNIDGEDLFAGLFISSSDVGTGSLSVNFYIWKQVCSNGLIVSQFGGRLLHKRHVGVSAESFSEALTAASENYPELVRNAEELVRKNRATFLDENQLELLLAKMAKEAGVSQKARDEILDLSSTRYSQNGRVAMWSVINGITEVAQKYTLERRTELELFAGKLLAA